MGIIQKTLAKLLNENQEPQASTTPENDSIAINGAGLTIGDNTIEGYKFQIGSDIDMLFAEDFDSGVLAFLKQGKYSATHITFAPVSFGSDQLQVESFNGVWESGNLVCKKFSGTIKGGTVDAEIHVKPGAEFQAHPGASVSGELNVTPPSIKDTKMGKDRQKSMKWVHLTSAQLSAYIQGRPFKYQDLMSNSRNEVLLSNYINQPIFGVKPVGACKIDKTSSELSLSLLALNSGQFVTFKDSRGRTFAFEVITSYKDSGNQISLSELTHDKKVVELTWNHFRVSTTADYNQVDFDANSSIRVGVEMRIPHLFENNIIDDIVEIIVTNTAPELPKVEVVDKESSFKPTKIKF